VLAYAKSPIVTKAPIRSPEAQSDVVYWAQGFGGWGRFNGDSNAAAVHRDLAGFITGVDTRAGTNGRVGLAGGYTQLEERARWAWLGKRRDRAYRGLWRLELGALNLRAGGAYAFTPSTRIARFISRLLRSCDSAL